MSVYDRVLVTHLIVLQGPSDEDGGSNGRAERAEFREGRSALKEPFDGESRGALRVSTTNRTSARETHGCLVDLSVRRALIDAQHRRDGDDGSVSALAVAVAVRLPA